MPSRGELISAGFAGLAGILDTSSEDDDARIDGESPSGSVQGLIATVAAGAGAGKEVQVVGAKFPSGDNAAADTAVNSNDVLASLHPAGELFLDVSSSRPVEGANRKGASSCRQHMPAGSPSPSTSTHAIPSGHLSSASLLCHSMPDNQPSNAGNPISRMAVPGEPSTNKSLATGIMRPINHADHDQHQMLPSAIPQATLDRRGPQASSSTRLPIFDSDSEEDISGLQVSQTRNTEAMKPDDASLSHPECKGPTGAQARSNSHSPADGESNANITAKYVPPGSGIVDAARVQATSRCSTPVHGRRAPMDATALSSVQATNIEHEDAGMNFGMTDDMLLPPAENGAAVDRVSDRSKTPDPSRAMLPTVPPKTQNGPSQTSSSLKARRPTVTLAPVSVRSDRPAHEAALKAKPTSCTDHAPVAEPQSAPVRALRSIATPAEQLRQKDENITFLLAKVQTLESQVAAHQANAAAQVASATQSARAAAAIEHESMKAALAQAKQDLVAAKGHASTREAVLQKQLRELQLALSTAADEAATTVAHARDQAARDVRDADSRARLRIDAELASRKSQLEAEAAAVKEERALLDRNRQSTETLASLSARVEVASSAAIQREERLAARLEADLHERERRCQQREVAVSQREAAIASAEQDGDVMRKQLFELSAKAQAAASQDAVAAAEDRRRLQHDAARLDAAVSALELQRKEIAAGIDMERQTLQATRTARDEERTRFMQEVTEERRRLAEERTAAWADMDRIHSEAAQAQRKVVELEAQSAAALLEMSKARDSKAQADMDAQQAKAQLRMQQKQLEADQIAVESERIALLNDSQMLHTSTQQLRELRDGVAEEKKQVVTAMQQLEESRHAIRAEQAAAEAQAAAAVAAERKLDELRIKLSEKRSQLSTETVKHGRIQAAWHVLQEQVQKQLCEWNDQQQFLPKFAVMWDILVTAEDGQVVTAVPHPQATDKKHTEFQTHKDETGQHDTGKENVKQEQMAFLTQKLSVLESIIKKRRSAPQQHDANMKFMADMRTRHRELGISETLAWGRQNHAPVFPVNHLSSSHIVLQHPSPMQTPKQPPNLGLAAAHGASAPVRPASSHPSPAAPVDWKLPAFPAHPVPAQHAANATTQRNSSLPTGFVPLQPVSTTEDSFSYRGSLEQSRASKQQSPSASHNVTESATSQDNGPQNHQGSPGTESCRN
eukprot:jgi/Ulvmu1/4792/UM020_0077.1